MNLAAALARELDGRLERVSLVRLRAQGHVYRHVDDGCYYAIRDRYHVPILSNGSEMKCGSEGVTMRPGELWWFDNKKCHESRNPSPVPRIHLIFDVLPFGVSLRRPSLRL